jgi:hypothetical protein
MASTKTVAKATPTAQAVTQTNVGTLQFVSTGHLPLNVQTQLGSTKKGTQHTGTNTRLTLVQAVQTAHPKGFNWVQWQAVYNQCKANGAITNTSGTAFSYLKYLTLPLGKYFTAQ